MRGVIPTLRAAVIATVLIANIGPPAYALCIPCTVAVGSASLPFGSYNPALSGATSTTGTIRLTASGQVGGTLPVVISLSAGNGTYATRTMRLFGSALRYNVYVSPVGAVFGDGTGATSTVAANLPLTAIPTAFNVPIFGKIPAAQALPAGVYSDTLIVTVLF